MLIFIYGQDTYSSRQKLREFRDKFLKEVDPSGNDIVRVDGSCVTMEQINEVVSPSSLFSKKRLIVIENIFSNSSKIVQDQVCDFFRDRQDNENIIIFWDEISGKKMGRSKLFKFLSTQKFVQKFDLLDDIRLGGWIRAEFDKKGAQINAQAVAKLIGMFGGDLWRLNNEINKLVAYKKGEVDKDVTVGVGVEDLDKMSVGEIDENIFALTDAISLKNKSLALELLENEIITGSAPIYLLQMIMRQFRILLQIKQLVEEGKNKNEIVSQTKLHPFVVQKSMAQSKNFSLPVLKIIFDKLVGIDQGVKTGTVDLVTVLDLIIVKI